MTELTFEASRPVGCSSWARSRSTATRWWPTPAASTPSPSTSTRRQAASRSSDGLAASGWFTSALWMRRYVDEVLTKAIPLGSPGGEEISWPAPGVRGRRAAGVGGGAGGAPLAQPPRPGPGQAAGMAAPRRRRGVPQPPSPACSAPATPEPPAHTAAGSHTPSGVCGPSGVFSRAALSPCRRSPSGTSRSCAPRRRAAPSVCPERDLGGARLRVQRGLGLPLELRQDVLGEQFPGPLGGLGLAHSWAGTRMVPKPP